MTQMGQKVSATVNAATTGTRGMRGGDFDASFMRDFTMAFDTTGSSFTGAVTRILDFGAFVEILPKVEGLVHVSEMAPYRVGKVTDIVQVGQMVNVVVKEIDSMGRLNLSMKLAEGNIYPPAPSPEEQASFGRSGGGKPSTGGSRPPRKDF